MSSVIKNTVPRVQPRRVPAAGETIQDQPVSLKIASPYVLEAKQLHKSYRKGRHVVPVLKGCDFQAISGDVTAILGHSGSGKSTLLTCSERSMHLIKVRFTLTAGASTTYLAPNAITFATQSWE